MRKRLLFPLALLVVLGMVVLPPAPRPLCSGFFLVDCSRQCAGGGQQSATGEGCTCDAAKNSCAARLTCSGTTTFGPCDS